MRAPLLSAAQRLYCFCRIAGRRSVRVTSMLSGDARKLTRPITECEMHDLRHGSPSCVFSTRPQAKNSSSTLECLPFLFQEPRSRHFYESQGDLARYSAPSAALTGDRESASLMLPFVRHRNEELRRCWVSRRCFTFVSNSFPLYAGAAWNR